MFPRTLHPVRHAWHAGHGLACCRKLPNFQIARLTKVSTASVSRVLRRHRARLAILRPGARLPTAWAAGPRRSDREAPGDLLYTSVDIKKLARIARLGHRMTGNPGTRSHPGRRLGVPPYCHRRPFPPRLRPALAGRDRAERHHLPPRLPRLLPRPRGAGPARLLR